MAKNKLSQLMFFFQDQNYRMTIMILDQIYLKNWNYAKSIERFEWNYPILVSRMSEIEFAKMES